MKKILNNNLSENYSAVLADCIYEQLPVNIFVSDRYGYVIWGNTRVMETLKTTEDEFIWRHLSKWGKENWNNCKKVIETGQEHKEEEIGVDNRFYLTSRRPFFSKDKSTILGIIGVSLDITDKKTAQMTKEAFIMNMNHDIRTPFCGIIGIFGLLHMAENDPEKKKWIEMGLESSKRLLNFMIDVRELSEVGHLPLDYETFGITQMADDVLLFLEATVKSRGLGVIKDYDGDMVYSNPFRIKHILLNILGNAIKFTEKGGIGLSIKTTPNLVITVQDSGIGIDRQYHEKIFEECFKVKPSYKNSDYAGVGKGLYLVKNYVKDLQGKVTVQSATNEGAMFTVEIPLNIEQTAA